MLPAFNMLAASILALAWLAVGLLFPVLAVWFGVRVARDLRRIAGALEASARYDLHNLHVEQRAERIANHEPELRVHNSMFGR